MHRRFFRIGCNPGYIVVLRGDDGVIAVDDDRLRPFTASTIDEVLETFFELHPSSRSQGTFLFFDEIHQILGAGGMGDGNGSKGMSDILKPATNISW